MKSLSNRIGQFTVSQLIVLALLMCLSAFLINLGAVAFIGDEAIRSLVAFEMYKSGDFLVPTLNGEAYYNKPPLYNWLIYANNLLFGHFGEWPARTTTLIFLAAFAYTVYHYSRKHFDGLTSATLAFMLVTSGRILFWDSMLGLIDICFSWVIFLQWMILYHFGKEGSWRRLFIFTYCLFAFAFLLKGLPALVFHGLSLLATLYFFKAVRKKIISADHLLGILTGLIILLAYYIPYADRVSIHNVFTILFDQSIQRTGTHHGISKTLLHLVTFPLEQFYHFLPWTILIIPACSRSFRQQVRENQFLRFNLMMVVVNIPVYWISVQVYPRYLLMFLPVLHLAGYYFTILHPTRWAEKVKLALLVMVGLALAATLLMPVYSKLHTVDCFYLIWFGSSLLIAFCFLGMCYDKRQTLLWMCIALLGVRTVFNLVVLPLRQEEFPENHSRNDIMRAASLYKDHPWLIYKETETHQVARFYTSAYIDQIIYKVDSIADPNAYYLVDRKLYPTIDMIPIDSILLERGQVLHLMQPTYY
ncbi:MAG: glycosyltransferase family 39 protein [Bacteroidota bacterium]|nr:glycosyltransferase family 39 protein [Bacteroidota bacterium]